MIHGNHGESGAERGPRRLRGFLVHLVGYFVVMAALVAVNLAASPENPWFVWPLVGWGGVLAFHAAHVMGLFGSRRP